jgi:hypothetical protein
MNEKGAIKNSTFKRVQKQVKKLHQNWMCNLRGGNGLMSLILPHPSLNQNIYHPTPTLTRSDKVERKIFHLADTRPKSIHFFFKINFLKIKSMNHKTIKYSLNFKSINTIIKILHKNNIPCITLKFKIIFKKTICFL